ncbi:hypothetical protein BX616_005961 [Lobosporangium transversale]|uniref:Uncharacterized protein n=1 Tax=Lobosporangium transversale TaxID=64571 RepID=A0A1Y2GMM5_9FUNG|nr:hypothetical protein BCR41DRAFT_396142 [Lobosporangium transversale]KAF9915533.1 hypothetical protein BX616_005961 [Lobosporangium transversale]ORZ16000.1 hypothetical protein BCR41DRAFT_396142 [Lobosporangium transversale]|eukprot:XP_021881347.1 hypothetical protein BCR41DRAFT_396142 [Lobosporangium transversale]
MPPFELQQEVLPLQLPIQPLNISRRRTSRTVSRSDALAAVANSIAINPTTSRDGFVIGNEIDPKYINNNASSTLSSPTTSYGPESTAVATSVVDSKDAYISPLAWLSRVITKAGQDERLHYHSNGQHHHHHHHHCHHRSHVIEKEATNLPLKRQLFTKATVVTLEKKYATVHWAAEFYCTISSPFFALPVLLYLDPAFRWSAPDIHATHFAIFLAVVTALTSTLYHATLYKLFSSLDACFATIMFYTNTISLLRSLPDPYALMLPDLISTIVHWYWTPYIMSTCMVTLFLFSWRRTAMLSLLLMILMIPASVWGFVAHESWAGLAFGLVGLSMFAADRLRLFCGHSYWHLAGGLSLWYGISSSALSPK